MEPRSRAEFEMVASQPDEDVDLGRACLLIACEEYPALDVAHYVARLDTLGAQVRRRLVDRRPEPAALLLNRILFEEQGFAGNVDDYYDPRNSFLNDVLDRKTGIPITLSTLYREVGRRAGLDVEGVGLPGHFIVKVAGDGADVLVDPFHGGTLLTEDDCQKRLDLVFGGKVKLEPEMLQPWSPHSILGRVLRNLKTIYVKSEDFTRALWAIDLLLRLEPQAAEEIRDRGLIYAGLDCYAAAAADLEHFLTLAPTALEAPQVREKAAAMRIRASRLN